MLSIYSLQVISHALIADASIKQVQVPAHVEMTTHLRQTIFIGESIIGVAHGVVRSAYTISASPTISACSASTTGCV